MDADTNETVAASNMTRKERLAALKAVRKAQLAKLSLGQRIRVFVSLHTDPHYLWLLVQSASARAEILYHRFLLAIQVTFVKWLFALIRPVYRPYEVIVPSVMVLFGGVVVSNIYDDWTWFARSGSLLVVMAALMHTFDAKERVERAKIAALPALEQLIDRLDSQIRSELHASLFDPIRRSVQACQLRLERFDSARVGKTYKRYEIVAAICGTFVWGFGDLIGRLI